MMIVIKNFYVSCISDIFFFQCELVHGSTLDNMTVHHRLDKVDILALTPKILENHLSDDKIPSLSAFSLIVFDEAHHTRKGEPYMSIMKHYLLSKAKGENLPQVCKTIVYSQNMKDVYKHN